MISRRVGFVLLLVTVVGALSTMQSANAASPADPAELAAAITTTIRDQAHAVEVELRAAANKQYNMTCQVQPYGGAFGMPPAPPSSGLSDIAIAAAQCVSRDLDQGYGVILSLAVEYMTPQSTWVEAAGRSFQCLGEPEFGQNRIGPCSLTSIYAVDDPLLLKARRFKYQAIVGDEVLTTRYFGPSLASSVAP